MKRIKINLEQFCAKELEKLAKRASARAAMLRKMEPSDELCIQNGIEDRSYNTTANGEYFSYSGECTITMPDESVWHCTGVSSSGDAYYGIDGYIRKVRIS